MKFVKRFKTEADYNSYMGGDRLILPNISLIDEISDLDEEDSGVRFNSAGGDDPYNGYEYVDLGLPSGILWAKCNIGAEKESDYGLYFAWGETVGYKDASSGKSFEWSDYKYCNGTNTFFTKYCTKSSYGIVDNLTTLEPSDDAATINMRGSWRMPNIEECEELIDNTTYSWTTINGVNGGLFTGNNGNTIFFPASGYYYGGKIEVISSGFYWSSSLDTSDCSYFLYVKPAYTATKAEIRPYGCLVRGVIG